LEQNNIKLSISFERCLYTVLWKCSVYTYTCYDQRRLCHVIIVLNI